MAAVCRAALAEVAPLAQTLNVDVVWVLAPAALVGDEGRMVQAVSNLCRNAVEAAAGEWGTGRVTVSCRTANELVAIEVRDSGPGILAGDVGSAFEPFHTTKADGTGLGLPIARGIVETHGGRLVVYRRDSETVFRIELPAMPCAGSGSPPK